MKWLDKIFESKRDTIFSGNAHLGTILMAYPKHRSYFHKPYLVRIIQTDNDGFTTELVNPEEHPNPHTHRFEYNSASWVDYHCDRFKIIKP